MYHAEFDDPGYLTRFNAAGREALRSPRSLRPPAAERRRVEETIDAMTRMVGALDGRIADLRSDRSASSSRRVIAYLEAYGDLAVSAGVVGLTECQGVSL